MSGPGGRRVLASREGGSPEAAWGRGVGKPGPAGAGAWELKSQGGAPFRELGVGGKGEDSSTRHPMQQRRRALNRGQ